MRSFSTVNSDESPLKAGDRLSTKFLPLGLNSARGTIRQNEEQIEYSDPYADKNLTARGETT